MAVNILNTSTLSEALDKEKNDFTVGSTSNITVGQLLVIQGTAGLEAVRVQEIPVSGRVRVKRAIAGTKARAHKSGTRFFIGDADDFQGVRDGVIAGIAGDPGDFENYLIPGSRYTDAAGNIYVLVELTQTVVPGATCRISNDGNFTAAVLDADSGSGSVGIVVENSSSDQYAWVQVYGHYAHAKLTGGSSLVTSLGEFQASSDVSTPSVGLLGRSSSQRSSDYGVAALIYGMFPTSAASTASTSASSETGLFAGAWLNFPYVIRPVTT